MNEIKTTTNLWVAVTKGGYILCYGKSNEHLPYHIANMQFVLISDRIVWGIRRWEIMMHIKKWNKECGNKIFKCKAVKVAITIETIKKGKNDEQ